jgi:hypothetical protein
MFFVLVLGDDDSADLFLLFCAKCLRQAVALFVYQQQNDYSPSHLNNFFFWISLIETKIDKCRLVQH